jgi:hypothetical protein
MGTFTDTAVATDMGGGTDMGGTDAASTDAGNLVCGTTEMSNLPDVSIEFPAQPCVFTLAQAAAGISIDYNVVVGATVTGVIPVPQDAGQCDQPHTSGVILFENLGGGGENYCICDTGLCFPPPMIPVTLNPGTYPGAFAWMGNNWFGPSDTGNPMGAPFPPGTYTLTVSAEGSHNGNPYTVEGTFTVYLIP